MTSERTSCVEISMDVDFVTDTVVKDTCKNKIQEKELFSYRCR